jgi:hypothetical protein
MLPTLADDVVDGDNFRGIFERGFLQKVTVQGGTKKYDKREESRWSEQGNLSSD